MSVICIFSLELFIGKIPFYDTAHVRHSDYEHHKNSRYSLRQSRTYSSEPYQMKSMCCELSYLNPFSALAAPV